MVRSLEIADYDTWVALGREVEHLFGPMADSEEFREGIRECIQRRDAYGVEDADGQLVGIIALERENNEILWLAVKEKCRGNGYGELLVRKGVEELEHNGDISVQTFAVHEGYGRGARVLYERSGFVDSHRAGKNPAGIDTVLMVRRYRAGS
jgi:GNAT superfamily N-acetyltransferase